MIPFLKNHPFAVEAVFERSLVLTFAVPKTEAAALLPECLTPDTFDDEWAFLAVALVQTKALRPAGLPAWLGNDFFLIGYRVFVRYTTSAGKRLRGLYILKSETDRAWMVFLGNLFTHYKYTTTDIAQRTEGGIFTVSSQKSKFRIGVRLDEELVALPPESPFRDWKEARRFAGPLPFTFTYESAKKQVLIIEGVRENWQPRPVSVVEYENAFLNTLRLNGLRLASAFAVENIPYRWEKGRIDAWNG